MRCFVKLLNKRRTIKLRGKKTSPEKTEEVKSLSIAFEANEVAKKTGVSLRTVYAILAKKDNPVIEAKREEKRLEIVDRVFSETEEEIQVEITKLKLKEDMLLEHLTPEKAEKARVTELTTGYGTIFDKRRLIEGKSTANISERLVFNVVSNDNRFTQPESKSGEEEIAE